VKIVRQYPDRAIFASGALLAIGVCGYLYRLAGGLARGRASRTHLLAFTAAGLLVFGLGYVICFASANVGFTPTGVNNRIAIAAAAGVALVMVGTVGWVAGLLPSPQSRGLCFSVLIAALSSTGFVINNTLASFWTSAYRRQQDVISGIRLQFPSLPHGSVLILDGICPYVGPAVIFDSSWDLKGVLSLLYRDRSLQANVVTRDIQVRKDGLYTTMSNIEYRYPYENLFIYDASQNEAHFLPDTEAARRYFRTLKPHHRGDCPPAHHGNGLPVF
jgi:MFS family permease